MSIEVKYVENKQEQIDFKQLVYTVYANDPFYLPITDYFPSEGVLLVSYENNIPVARCSVSIQTGSNNIGTIGTFQALDKPEAVKLMLNRAVQWLKEQSVKIIIGPMDGDTWHHYRFTTGPFDNQPFIKEPWNPPYYPKLWESANFSVSETYDSYIVDEPSVAAANQEKFYKRCVKNGYSFTPITKKKYKEILPLIYELSCQIFSQNVLYTPISIEEFIRMYSPAEALLQTGLSWIAFAPDNSPAGYIFTFPDYTDALMATNGKSNLLAKIKFLLNKQKAARTCIKTLGVLERNRGSGLTAALTYLSYKNSAELGYGDVLMCLMHSSNDSRRFSGKADKPFRKYVLYEYSK